MRVLVVRHAFTFDPKAACPDSKADMQDMPVGRMINDPEMIGAIETAGQAHFCTAAEVDDAFFTADPDPAPASKAKAAPAATANG